MRFYRIIYLPLFLLLFSGTACQKQTEDAIQWELIQDQQDYRLWSAHFLNADTGYVCGGNRYDNALLLHTTDGGNSWHTQETGIEKIVFDIQFLNAHFGVATAYDAKILVTRDGGSNWELQQQYMYGYPWQALRAVDFTNDTLGLVVGGQAYNTGLILRTQNGAFNWDFQAFEQELRDVFWTDSQTAYVCGYGVVYKTEDAGDTWFLLPVKGDFFTSIHFPSPQIGYVVGYQGSIFKTEDAGASWQTLRRGESVFKKNHHFERVYFRNTEEGYIVGVGSCLYTDDGGESWQQVADLDFQKFNAIVPSGNNNGFIVGDEGNIIRFDNL